MNIEKLIHDLRARINPQYYDQIGTESYERHQVVKALEYLATENERLKELMAKRTREHQQEMTSFRLRVRSQDDATIAALRDEVNGLTGELGRERERLDFSLNREGFYDHTTRVFFCDRAFKIAKPQVRIETDDPRATIDDLME
jgi:hypothetical protein